MQQPKPPLKFKIKISSKRENNLYGKAIFHNNIYKLVVKPSKGNDSIKIPFKILGIMNEPHLVRLSGAVGAYTEFRLEVHESSKNIEIYSSTIIDDVKTSKKKYDTVEIFVN
tara:strand:- start:2347 stop:2682 length:336 start_codon:yes stop_codon:yes gene_type:complete